MLDVETPSSFYPALDGMPLQFGQVYFGVSGQNPVTNPITVYWDAGGTQPAAQPISVANGLTMRDGTPARVYVPSGYSRLVQDSKAQQVSFDAALAAPLRPDLAASSGSSLVGFIQAGAGAVARTAQGKIGDIFSVRDFSGSDQTQFTSLGAANNGGLAIVPNASYTLTAEVTAAGKYINNSSTLLPTSLFPGDAFGVVTAKHLQIVGVTGSNLNKKRFASHEKFTSDGPGSTVALTGTGDFGRGLTVTKNNYLTTVTDGEIGGHYTVVRQGGGAASDCSAELYDVQTASTSFGCITEGAMAKVNGLGTVTDRVRVITGFLKKSANDMGGLSVNLEVGAASNLQYMEVANGTTATNLLKFVDLTTGLYSPNIFAMDAAGQQITFMRNALSSTIDSSITVKSTNAYDNNRDELRERLYRRAAGSDYATAEWRLERIVDNATIGGGMTLFYDPAIAAWGAALTINGTRVFQVASGNRMGFNGAGLLVQPALPVAAVDAATTQALSNAIRSALINYGLTT